MINTTEEIIDDIKNGKIVILMDDEQRENEGDLICAGECVTPEIINFMITFGRGLVCMPLSNELANYFNLPLMVENNQSGFKTKFTISIEAKTGIHTGISAFDRATTIQAIVKDGAEPDDIVSPGHIFPLRSDDNGVLGRDGHTEASIDLVRLAGFKKVAVICEILSKDGTMARKDELITFAQNHGLKIGTIKNLINYLKR